MLAVTEPGVHIITAMVSTQLLKTSLLENVFGFFAHLDPCPMLLVQPKEDAAEQFSKERITPLVKATPALREIIGTGKTRSGDETLLYKAFPGGFLALAGAGSPDNLARRPVRVVMYDETDKYPITREGDPIALGDERTATFANWLSVRACSPTVEDESRIAASYEDSDQRKASVACPHCGHRQFLDFFKHVEWTKDERGIHHPETARLHCESCGSVWSEGDRLRSLQSVRWHQTKAFDCCGQRHDPLTHYDAAWREDDSSAVDRVWQWWSGDRHAVYRAICSICGGMSCNNEHAGFQASKLFSPWPKDKPANIAKKYLGAKGDPDQEQAWWNTQMGLPHRPFSGKEVNIEALLSRAEKWAAQIPDGVAVLTAGIDTQDDRIEIELVGWGRNEESWSIEHHVIEGSFDDPDTQSRLDEYLMGTWMRGDGRAFEIMGACMDSGGHHTQSVYEFCKARIGRRIWAIKGESARDGKRSPVWPAKRITRKSKAGYRPIIIGVNTAKDSVRQRLQIESPGPGYMHFPHGRDVGYYTQLTAEKLVTKVVSGRMYRVWQLPSGRANEALDCRVYAYATLCGLTHMGLKLNKRAEEVGAIETPLNILAKKPAAPSDQEQIPEHPAPAPAPAPKPKDTNVKRVRRLA